MVLPGSLDAFFHTNMPILLLMCLVASVLIMVCLIVTMQRLAKLNRLYVKMTRGVSGGNLEEIIIGYADSVGGVKLRTEALEKRTESHAHELKNCFKKVGIVRYDAFEDVGGEQSFSFVLLNEKSTGVAVSSVYSRNDVRVYAKAVREGKPSHPLTQEELQALKLAEGS
ncbi:MAG: DUF4446 family protein [Chthonomonadales bacterium]